MPLPIPKEGESKEEFISRCMSFQDKEGKLNLKDKGDREQALAICYSQWEREHGKSEYVEFTVKSFSEILNEKL